MIAATIQHQDAIIFLPKTNKARKRRYLHASRRRDMTLADWVFSVCDDACNLRCLECGGELSQCGEQGTDGEPTLDCIACRMRDTLRHKDDKICELGRSLKRFLEPGGVCTMR